ncbi:probable autolytic lysozyme [Planococcus citri]|uniref:probable autolytic lysozyme n=1 Tax=Planococcus citri TaxID=170843 RepID=UPI0031FA0C33
MRMQCAVVELEIPNYQSALDVSWHQGKINWKKVKNTGIEHVIMKATEGSYHQDVTFLYNWEMARMNNIRTSVYHYFRALMNPDEQVANVIKTLNLTTFNYREDILAIDVEEKGNELASPDQVAHTLHRFLKGLESNNFVNVYIYCNYNYWENQVNWRIFDFSKYPLWIAWYNSEINSQPKIPSTWKTVGWTYWQYSNLGKVDGIDTYVDLDFCKTCTTNGTSVTS